MVSFVAGINFYAGATAWGGLTVFLINAVGRRRQIGGDAAIGIVTTAAFALGVALISRQRTFTRDFEAALFGETPGDQQTAISTSTTGVTALVGVMLVVYWRPLIFVTFDQHVAESYGVPVRRVEALFSLALAATVIALLAGAGRDLDRGRRW